MFTKSIIIFFILTQIYTCVGINWEPVEIPVEVEYDENKYEDLDNILNTISPFTPLFISFNTCIYTSFIIGLFCGRFKRVILRTLLSWFIITVCTTNSIAAFVANLFCFSIILITFLIGSRFTR